MAKKIHSASVAKLVIAVAIVGILTQVAIPGYQQYAARVNRNDARAALLQIAVMQEKFYLNNNTYTKNMTDLGFRNVANNVTSSKSYIINVDAADARNFNATATYQKADAEAQKCATLQIDSRGQKISAPLADCWNPQH